MYDDDDLVEDEKCARCKHRVATVFDDDIPVPLCDQCAMWVRTNPNVCDYSRLAQDGWGRA